MFKVVFIIALLIGTAFPDEGIDTSVYQGVLDSSDFECFVNNGKTFFINQIWQGSSQLISDFSDNWHNAKNAGIAYVDGYAYICSGCDGNTAENICSSIAGNLPSGFDGQIWLDIEDCSSCWSDNSDNNLNFIDSVASTCISAGLNMGVYSSYYEWQSVVGSSDASTPTLSSLPLWYAHYDSDSSFSDWSDLAFGGWSSPNIKQYSGDASLCGITVDLDYYPS